MKSLIFGLLILISTQALGQVNHYALDTITNYKLSYHTINTSEANYKVANHFYTNNNKKLFIAVHGYLETCGYIKHINDFILNSSYDILCLDLPGHGESSGTRADINDFKTYGHVLDHIDFTNLKLRYKEVNFIAHSTGALTYLNYLRRGKSSPFDKVVLIAPLVRSRVWYPSRFGYFFAKYFIDTLARKPKKSLIYNRIKNSDPHYVGHMSFHWFGKLIDWNDSIQENDIKFKSEKIFGIFGENDEVIDTAFNLDYYKTHFNMNYKVISNAHHHMDHDGVKVRQEFYKTLGDFLKL